MGIQTDIDDLTEADINDLLAADELLAEVLRDFSRDFRQANETNREVAGAYVAYTVSVDGREVYSGKGQFFPEGQLSTYLSPKREAPKDKIREIIITWLWAAAGAQAAKAIAKSGFAAIGATLGVEPSTAFRAARLGARVARMGRSEEENEIDVLLAIAQELVDSSPVLTGTYQESHVLYADGSEVGSAQDIIDGAEIPAAETYIFVSQSPYARKIENKFGFHVYESVAASAQREFPDVYIAFEWRESDLPGLPTGKRPYRFPAIVVQPR